VKDRFCHFLSQDSGMQTTTNSYKHLLPAFMGNFKTSFREPYYQPGIVGEEIECSTIDLPFEGQWK